MAGKKNMESIKKICGGQDEKYAGFKKLPCEHFNTQDFECEILRSRKVPDLLEIKRCQSIVMYYAEILATEQWNKDGRATDHEDPGFDTLFKGLHGTSLRGFDEEKGQRYEISYWHGYIKKAVRNAILKKIKNTDFIVRSNDSAPEDSDEDRLQKMVFTQTSFSKKKDLLETDLNAKVELSWLVDSLTEIIDDPDTSEKDRLRRRRTLIINLLHRIRRDRFADEACRELRKERARTRRERERLRAEMKFDRKALMEFFSQKKTTNA